ncbi:uncharacterized protein LACBIDRAFT_302176 [Laccaria bicolor S238N-H82]|uniref:Predicted protein n=1 Tax=Laccaria bicolor (strain S238N-H82 / ATCC MYA-4686) TaxID=486041 RepID=B0DH89_LACBS|nr:uncharacterized protein LACBIDRAFT_302176 [Laccaria bicolor S238N-H82]EDR06068.1 predicted protein [Laccaria bicolor S238N-H82]|eukprot:XP_001883356.1 predicted protein [Laccaria bicolor S238N-H82]
MMVQTMSEPSTTIYINTYTPHTTQAEWLMLATSYTTLDASDSCDAAGCGGSFTKYAKT